MSESRIIFQCTDEGNDIVGTRCECKNAEDFRHIIVSILHVCKGSELFMMMLLDGIKMLVTDEEFQQAFDEASIDCPDFNEILKNE